MKSKDNILKALVYEQAAHYNYKRFAQEARKEGLDHVEEIFMQLAIEERDHKERLITVLKQLTELEQEEGLSDQERKDF